MHACTHTCTACAGGSWGPKGQGICHYISFSLLSMVMVIIDAGVSAIYRPPAPSLTSPPGCDGNIGIILGNGGG